MSDNMESTSLGGLAAYKGKVNRDGPDAKAKNVSSQATSQGGFTGFLNTFLGKDKVSAKSGKAATNKSQSRLGYNQSVTGGLNDKSSPNSSKKTATPASKMDSGQKKALRKSLDKTVPADDAHAEAAVDSVQDPLDPEVIAAAEEAARLIWELLYAMGGGAADDYNMYGMAAGPDSLRQLAGLLGGAGMGQGGDGLAGMGTAGLDMDALQQAIETANASAEMNSAAVLSALDDLLDRMPREALADALAKTAGAMGMDGSKDIFNQIAAALDAEIIAVENGESADLLSFLAAGSNPLSPENTAELSETTAQNIAPLAAENAGIGTTDEEIFALFQQFVSEKMSGSNSESPINENEGFSPESGEEMLNSFVAWLVESGKTGNNKELTGNLDKLAQALLRAASGDAAGQGLSAEQGGDVFSRIKSNLENLLHPDLNKNAAQGASESAKNLSQSVTGNTGEAAGVPFVLGQAAPGAASVPATSTAAAPTMSGMMDQIENIERLAEVMRMANRGAVKNLTMQLSPPELGKVMLRVESRDGVVSAFLRVEKPEAAAQLANNLSQLRENLKAQGIELGDLDIQQRGQHEALGDFSGQRQKREAEVDYEDRYGSGRQGNRAGVGEAETVEPATETSGNANGVLNLFA